jgi:hypothetical protein
MMPGSKIWDVGDKCRAMLKIRSEYRCLGPTSARPVGLALG